MTYVKLTERLARCEDRDLAPGAAAGLSVDREPDLPEDCEYTVPRDRARPPLPIGRHYESQELVVPGVQLDPGARPRLIRGSVGPGSNDRVLLSQYPLEPFLSFPPALGGWSPRRRVRGCSPAVRRGELVHTYGSERQSAIKSLTGMSYTEGGCSWLLSAYHLSKNSQDRDQAWQI